MSSLFQKVTLGDVARIVGGGTPSTKDASNYNGDIPWITPKDLSTHSERYVERGKRSITEKGLSSSSAKLLPAKSVLFTSRAPIGYVALAKTELCTNQGFKNLVLNEGQIPEFYYYLMRCYTLKIESHASGSTFKEVSGGVLKSIEVEVPDTGIQKAIAHILGALDDRIELNQKMNETLEEIAKAIFKSWFVDFDPVRAKMAGRPTALPPEISDLFPDELLESEIGEIPKGWEISRLGDFTTLTKGRSYKKAELQESDVALVTLKSFLRGGGYRLDGLKSYTGKYKVDQIVCEGDLIVALTDLTQAADVIGKPAIARSSSLHSTLVASLDVGILRTVDGSKVTKDFCYYLMLTDRYTSHSLGYTSGTTVLHLAKDATENFEFACPRKDMVDRFSEIVEPIHHRVFLAEKENEVLTELRDTLLPKLISGELQIPDAEKFLEEAGI